jgi:hypothetical protein
MELSDLVLSEIKGLGGEGVLSDLSSTISSGAIIGGMHKLIGD